MRLSFIFWSQSHSQSCSEAANEFGLAKAALRNVPNIFLPCHLRFPLLRPTTRTYFSLRMFCSSVEIQTFVVFSFSLGPFSFQRSGVEPGSGWCARSVKPCSSFSDQLLRWRYQLFLSVLKLDNKARLWLPLSFAIIYVTVHITIMPVDVHHRPVIWDIED